MREYVNHTPPHFHLPCQRRLLTSFFVLVIFSMISSYAKAAPKATHTQEKTLKLSISDISTKSLEKQRLKTHDYLQTQHKIKSRNIKNPLKAFQEKYLTIHTGKKERYVANYNNGTYSINYSQEW